MLLHDFLPSTALRQYIKCIRIVALYFDPAQPIPSKVYPPKPEQVLHFIVKGPFFIEKEEDKRIEAPSILFAGQQTSRVTHFTGHNFLGIQIVFQPTAVYQLTGIPAPVFTNLFLDATLIFPRSISDTYTALLAATSYADMYQIAERCAATLVKNRAQEAVLLDAACSHLVQQHGNLSIDCLAAEACYSSRQFNRKFTDRVGVNPKTYAKLLRLNRAYNIRNAFPAKSWIAIAAQCGYTDYQHLAKDCKTFNKLTPAELQLADRQSPEQVLGLSKSIYRTRVLGAF